MYYYLRMIEKIKVFLSQKEHAFLVIFFVFGLLFVTITPPIYTVDESAHLYRAYQVSEFNLMTENIGEEAGGAVPKSLTTFVSNNMLEQGQKYSLLDRSKAQIHDQLDSSKTDEVRFTNVAIYPFLNYIPQAVGLRVGRLFTQSVLVQFYMARLFNLIFLGGCLFVAIKILGKNKDPLFVVGLLPMTLYLGASLSADTFVIGSVALFMAYVCKLFRQKNIVLKQWIILGCLAAAVALSKQTYFVLTFVILGLPLRKLKFNKDEFIKALIVLSVAMIPFGLFLFVTRQINTHPVALQNSVGVFADPSAQQSFILHQPLSFLKVALITLSDQKVLAGFIGNFGVVNIPLPSWALLAAVIALFLSFGTGEKRDQLSSKLAIIFGIAAVANVVLILAGLYVFWSNPKHAYVEQLQARYFIPILILLIPALIGRYRHTIKWRVITATMLVVLATSIITIMTRFYY